MYDFNFINLSLELPRIFGNLKCMHFEIYAYFEYEWK